MFIARKELFDAYYTWLFDILFELEQRTSIKDYDDYNVCTYECYTWEPVTNTNLMFTMGNVCGGNYIFVENGDSKIPFKNITKVSSKRK